jgi:hypothetical protein
MWLNEFTGVFWPMGPMMPFICNRVYGGQCCGILSRRGCRSTLISYLDNVIHSNVCKRCVSL